MTAGAGAISIRDLAEATALDLDGRVRKLGEAWAERTAVIAWLRHFG